MENCRDLSVLTATGIGVHLGTTHTSFLCEWDGLSAGPSGEMCLCASPLPISQCPPKGSDGFDLRTGGSPRGEGGVCRTDNVELQKKEKILDEEKIYHISAGAAPAEMCTLWISIFHILMHFPELSHNFLSSPQKSQFSPYLTEFLDIVA